MNHFDKTEVRSEKGFLYLFERFVEKSSEPRRRDQGLVSNDNRSPHRRSCTSIHLYIPSPYTRLHRSALLLKYFKQRLRKVLGSTSLLGRQPALSGLMCTPPPPPFLRMVIRDEWPRRHLKLKWRSFQLYAVMCGDDKRRWAGNDCHELGGFGFQSAFVVRESLQKYTV